MKPPLIINMIQNIAPIYTNQSNSTFCEIIFEKREDFEILCLL